MPATAKVTKPIEPTSARTASVFGRMLRRWLLSFDSYHPELHYMRGPGPKWHAKHDHKPAIPEDHSATPGGGRALAAC